MKALSGGWGSDDGRLRAECAGDVAACRTLSGLAIFVHHSCKASNSHFLALKHVTLEEPQPRVDLRNVQVQGWFGTEAGSLIITAPRTLRFTPRKLAVKLAAGSHDMLPEP